jgi:polar amino acid transport system permease protein
MATDLSADIEADAQDRRGSSNAHRRAALAFALVLAGMITIWLSGGVRLPPTLQQVVHWSPALLGGFGLNILISGLAMASATAAGLVICALRLSPLRLFRAVAVFYVQLFRNAPKLTMVYFASYAFPFELLVGGHYFPFPDWLKVTVGLTLPASAYAAEIFRGAIQSIPSTQWEAARSLAFTRLQQLRFIILPQCIKRMLPPWMSLYAIVTMATSLASLVGAKDLLSVAQTASATVHSVPFTVIIYFTVMALFFSYCYPLSLLTRRLERANGQR